jgi:putative flippase GtrA
LSRRSASLKEKISSLRRRYSKLFRAAEFGLAGAIGFLVAEGILTLGVIILYGSVNVPSAASFSSTLLALNVLAFGIGVTVAFFVNEEITVRKQVKQERAKGLKSVLLRLLKFQGVYLAGNVITVGVQLALLRMLSVSPALGNIVGAIAAYPMSYFVSMRYVWKISGSNGTPTIKKGETESKSAKAGESDNSKANEMSKTSRMWGLPAYS